jgi:hypothetical protein
MMAPAAAKSRCASGRGSSPRIPDFRPDISGMHRFFYLFKSESAGKPPGTQWIRDGGDGRIKPDLSMNTRWNCYISVQKSGQRLCADQDIWNRPATNSGKA